MTQSTEVCRRRRRLEWVTLLQAVLLLLVLGLAADLVRTVSVRAQSPAVPGSGGQDPGGFGGGPQGRGGRGGPGMQQQERKLVAQFDKNGDKRLDAVERKAAREWLESQPAGGPGGFGRGGPGGRGRGGFGGRGFAPSSSGRRLTPADVKSYEAAPLYDAAVLRTIFLRFESADWEQELEAFNNTDVDVPATVIVDGKTYKDVGVHFRGMSSYFMVPAGSKRSLNVSFDFVHEAQEIGGYHTLNLLNANGDPTFVRGMLYAEISGHYIPTPKMNYVRAVINDESWGVYLNVEQFNKDFLRDFYGTTKGARWKVPGSPGGRGGMEYLGDNVDVYKRIYDIKSKDDPKAWADLVRLFRVLNETPADKLEAALEPILDIDGALKFLALDVALVNSDGFWTRASDYDIYQDEKGRFHVLPHDFNEALAEEGGGRGGPRGGPGRGFPGGDMPPGGGPPDVGRGMPPGGGRGMFGRAGVDLDPLVGLDDSSKPLRSKLLAVPSLRKRYLANVRDIAERWLDWATLEPLVRKYQALIAEDVKADTRKLYTFEAFQADVSTSEDSLKRFIERRRAFLLK